MIIFIQFTNDEKEILDPWMNMNQEGAQEGALPCVDRWKNAGSDARKKMFHMFAVNVLMV